jgi:integrase
MRLGDAMRLTWGNIDLTEKVITFTPSKTARLGKKLAIPMHEEIETFLIEHPAGKSDKDPLFASLQHLAIGGRSGASMAFRRIMDRAKVAAGTAREGEGKKGRDVSARTFHALRHTYVTALSTAGVAVEVRQKLAGHASEAQSLHYTHPEFQSLRDAVTKLPALRSVRK